MIHVVHGAKLFCPFGVKPDSLKASRSTITAENKPVGLHTDSCMLNFGVCTVKGGVPCTPKLSRWLNIDPTIKEKGKNPIIYPSTNICTTGGGAVMTVTSGQRKLSKFASSGKKGTIKCDWQDCQSNHIEDIEYSLKDEDCLKRIPFPEPGWELGWTKPHNYESVYGRRNPHPTKSKRKGNNHAENYPTEQHHIIPIGICKEVPKLENNLILLGWDINNEVLNGIVLPKYTVDIFFHDLQIHQGLKENCHARYNNDILKELKKVQQAMVKAKLCEKDEQYKLIETIYNFVKNKRQKIIDWEIIIYRTFSNKKNRTHSFERAGLSKPISYPPQKRKFLF